MQTPIAMTTFTNIRSITITMAFTLQLMNITHAQKQLVVSGHILAMQGTDMPWAILADINGAAVRVHVTGRGRFRAVIPAGGTYQIIFSRNGCSTKVIEIDRRGHSSTEPGRVQFDVELKAGDPAQAIIAGSIGFAPGTGRIIVLYGAKEPPMPAGTPTSLEASGIEVLW
jgi:hypothetical protein